MQRWSLDEHQQQCLQRAAEDTRRGIEATRTARKQLRTDGLLTDTQLTTLQHVEKTAKQVSDAARPSLLARVQQLDYDECELHKAEHYIRAHHWASSSLWRTAVSILTDFPSPQLQAHQNVPRRSWKQSGLAVRQSNHTELLCCKHACVQTLPAATRHRSAQQHTRISCEALAYFCGCSSLSSGELPSPSGALFKY